MPSSSWPVATADAHPAPLIRRLLAALIDAVPVGALAFGALSLVALVERRVDFDILRPIVGFPVCLFTSLTVYGALLEGRFGGSIGKRLLGLRVRTVGAGRVGPALAARRWALKGMWVAPLMTAGGVVGFFWAGELLDAPGWVSQAAWTTAAILPVVLYGMMALFLPDRRLPHDHAAGTIVVRRA
jgi:uncharacterized RDD family membrane protein YckC